MKIELFVYVFFNVHYENNSKYKDQSKISDKVAILHHKFFSNNIFAKCRNQLLKPQARK